MIPPVGTRAAARGELSKSPSMRRGIALTSALAIALSGCGVQYLLVPRRHATVWTQSSGEYAATTLQIYALAEDALAQALGERHWTAALEQSGDFASLPPAVIVDIDETVLDNTPFHHMLDENELAFSEQRWADWVNDAGALAVPGAAEFLAFAESLGVEIFYVTNRDQALEAPTRENLLALGLPLDGGRDRVLTRGERPDWTRDKTSRRAFVASSHRVLLIVGDSLGDFVPDERIEPDRLREVAFEYQHMWGRRWFVLPNPIYGPWERGIGSLGPSGR